MKRLFPIIRISNQLGQTSLNNSEGTYKRFGVVVYQNIEQQIRDIAKFHLAGLTHDKLSPQKKILSMQEVF